MEVWRWVEFEFGCSGHSCMGYVKDIDLWFTSKEFKEFCIVNNIIQLISIAYNPNNREVTNKVIAQQIKAMAFEEDSGWLAKTLNMQVKLIRI